jgi:hypothetical protein
VLKTSHQYRPCDTRSFGASKYYRRTSGYDDTALARVYERVSCVTEFTTRTATRSRLVPFCHQVLRYHCLHRRCSQFRTRNPLLCLSEGAYLRATRDFPTCDLKARTRLRHVLLQTQKKHPQTQGLQLHYRGENTLLKRCASLTANNYRSDRPSPVRTNGIRGQSSQTVNEDRQSTISDTSGRFGLSRGTSAGSADACPPGAHRHKAATKSDINMAVGRTLLFLFPTTKSHLRWQDVACTMFLESYTAFQKVNSRSGMNASCLEKSVKAATLKALTTTSNKSKRVFCYRLSQSCNLQIRPPPPPSIYTDFMYSLPNMLHASLTTNFTRDKEAYRVVTPCTHMGVWNQNGYRRYCNITHMICEGVRNAWSCMRLDIYLQKMG